jgi:predicted nucleic acid-binding protein
MKEKLFFDTDVILDIATNREPFSIAAARLFSLVENGSYVGYTSSIVFTNVYYIQRKLADHQTAIAFLKKLRLILNILPVDDLIIQKALESGFADFEDGMQYFTSVQNKIDFIITRNVADYKKSVIPVHTPQEFLSLMQIAKE